MSPTEHPEAQDEGVRLSKRLAAQLGCSRAEAELYIESGAVQVDGITVQTPPPACAHSKPSPSRKAPSPKARPRHLAAAQARRLHRAQPQGARSHTRGKVGNAYDLLVPENLADVDTPAPILVLQSISRTWNACCPFRCPPAA
jgi:23S rRNA pseudouridine2604 synthase